ncbi:MAG: secondary thiamine-phosphate synthase enzyme YjbQ [Candidatus Omnitrophica bacterium]|nr:secondary thiamine-phosphate synthase enzyme YjbQ [Candidatus Omnitrophota bacterium]
METQYITLETKGNGDIIDITHYLERVVTKVNLEDGILFLNVIGSTAALTTMEYEPGLIKDLKNILEELIPYRQDYAHNFAWDDDNGHSHLRSSFIKTNFFVPVTKGKLDLGTWQQVILIDFDTCPRQRKIVVKVFS